MANYGARRGLAAAEPAEWPSSTMAVPHYDATNDLGKLPTALAEMRRAEVAAVALSGLFGTSELDQMLQQVYKQRRHWQTGAGPGDYTLGNVWYAHIEFGREQEYFATASRSRALVNRLFPRLEQQILALCRLLTGDSDVQVRANWGGPALVVFRAGSETARRGGVLHVDHDGLPVELLQSNQADAFSFILPLQLPAQRGHLLVWPDVFDPADRERFLVGSGDVAGPHPPVQLLRHEVGTALAIQSLRVHQIQGFDGDRDRVTLNWRLTRVPSADERGRWVVWF